MICFSSKKYSQIGVGFLILIQITGIVCRVRINNHIGNNNTLNGLGENYFQREHGAITEIEIVYNDLKSLPENLFRNLTNLYRLDISMNGLSSLPENIFKDQINLQELYLNENNLVKLPTHIFRSQTKLRALWLNGNRLTTLNKGTINDIFKNVHLNDLKLHANPWMCDCDFLDDIQIQPRRFSNLVCADGEEVRDKIEKPIISMITNKFIESTEYSQKYVNKTICQVDPKKETYGFCPSKCNCLFPNDKKSIFVDCSNQNLTNIPSVLNNITNRMPRLNKIELNFDNNSIKNLPNSTMQGFDLITSISAKNNSIETISLDNLPANLMEIDLSENQLKLLPDGFRNYVDDSQQLQVVKLTDNPLNCHNQFSKFIGLKKQDKIDYGNVVCSDLWNYVIIVSFTLVISGIIAALLFLIISKILAKKRKH